MTFLGNDTGRGRKRLMSVAADADAAVREAQAVQIAILERECETLKSAAAKQAKIVPKDNTHHPSSSLHTLCN